MGRGGHGVKLGAIAMAEPIPPADDLDDELRRAAAAIKALKHRPMGETDAQARARSVQLIGAQRRLKAAARQVADPSAAKSVNGVAPDASAANGVRQFVRAVAREIAALQGRIAELEASSLRDGETWKMGKLFTPGMVTTYDGALWVCKKANSDTRPPGDCWRLMHKTRSR